MKANTLTNTWGCDDKCIKFYEDKYIEDFMTNALNEDKCIEDVMTLVAGQRETRSFWADVSISSFLANTPCALFILPAFHRFTGNDVKMILILWECENVKMILSFKTLSFHFHYISQWTASLRPFFDFPITVSSEWHS